jgi:dihydropteroate synthase
LSEAVLNPIGLMTGDSAARAVAAGDASPLAGTGVAFAAVERITGAAPDIAPCARDAAGRSDPETFANLTAPRPPFAGLALDRPRIAGIVNVTPDSFSDGGDFADPARAIDRALALAADGADIIDIGGESTRPGAAPTPVAEELRRVLPVIEAVAGQGIPVSIDTRRAPVMRDAVAAGARIVNDVMALTHDADALAAVAETGACAILMHMQGTPGTMQAAPSYALASRDICRWLSDRVAACVAAGIPEARIAVDPGIGFGKTDAHNMEILDRAGMFHGLGCAVMVGVSRKSFIGRIAGTESPKDRLPGTILATGIALSRGVQLHRVHDVAEARQAVAIWQALHGVG